MAARAAGLAGVRTALARAGSELEQAAERGRAGIAGLGLLLAELDKLASAGAVSSPASELQDIRIARTAHSEAAPSWASLAAELEPELQRAADLSRRMSSADLNTLEISSAMAMASISLQCCRSEAGLEGLRQKALLLLGQL